MKITSLDPCANRCCRRNRRRRMSIMRQMIIMRNGMTDDTTMTPTKDMILK